MSKTPPFIHLHLHSAYSLAEGALKVKDLITLCKKQNMPAVAVTDTNNMFGALEFATTAAAEGVQPIIGCQLDVGGENEPSGRLVLLAQSLAGYHNLCKLVSAAYMDAPEGSDPHLEWHGFKDLTDDIICLSGGIEGPIGKALLANKHDLAESLTEQLGKLFEGRFYVEIQRHNLAEEDDTEDGFIDLAYRFDLPLVATNNCYFAEKEMYQAHDALLCIAGGRYVNENDRRRETQDHYFKSSAEMVELFKDLPEAVSNTQQIAQRCHFLLKPVDPILPPFPTESGRTETEELVYRSEEGLKWRLEHYVFTDDMDAAKREEVSKPYFERLEYELGIIIKMDFPGYFLIVSDFIQWSKDENIPVGPGRGSGAGSVVAWSLKITDLDPLHFNLLFERFLNPERVSMPDFDVDFCQDRRDEVIKYVQRHYGYDRVAQIITFGKLQAKAVVRDVGRVLQMPYGQVDRISKLIPANPANPVTLQEALNTEPDLRRERDRDETSQRLISIALQLEGLYRHASTHAAGVVIGDRPLDQLIPVYRDPRSDMPVTQFNMKFVEQASLVKFDFLGLKTMTVIQRAVEYIKKSKDIDIDILSVPLDDEGTYTLLTQGKTVGVFQLESTGMRDVLCKMKPNRFEDIIALVALYRPGPMDNIPRYIDIKEGKEEPDYMHPILKPYLEETYGIMIYQEQVMQAAQALAGYSLGGADLLRRAMGKKIKAAMDAERKKFMEGAAEHHDVPKEQSSAIFDQIAKFAGYGFNKSHAAAYALIAYWTAWLKANHPVEFMAASMTLDMGNTDKLSVFQQDLERMRIPLLPPDVNHSDVEFKVENEAVRYALAAIKGVGEHAMEELVKDRHANGPYETLYDLAERLDNKTINKKIMESLACAGGFDGINDNRCKIYSSVGMLVRYAQSQTDERESGQVSLFGGDAETSASVRPAMADTHDWTPMDRLKHEFDSIGFYLSAHPLDSSTVYLEKSGCTFLIDLERKICQPGASKNYTMAGVVLRKQERMSKSGKKFAFIQLSDPTGVYEGMVFSETLVAARELLEPGRTVILTVEAEQQEEQVRFLINSVRDLEKAQTRSVETLTVEMDNTEKIEDIYHILAQNGGGKVRVVFKVDADDCIAEVEVKERWAINTSTEALMSRVKGVTDVAFT